jgi:hypothetical protein
MVNLLGKWSIGEIAEAIGKWTLCSGNPPTHLEQALSMHG